MSHVNEAAGSEKIQPYLHSHISYSDIDNIDQFRLNCHISITFSQLYLQSNLKTCISLSLTLHLHNLLNYHWVSCTCYSESNAETRTWILN